MALLQFSYFFFAAPSQERNTHTPAASPQVAPTSSDPTSFDTPELVFLNLEAQVGDCFAIELKNIHHLAQVTAKLISDKGGILATSKGYPSNNENIFYSLIPVSLYTKPGEYFLDITIHSVMFTDTLQKKVRVLETEFVKEEIYLNAQNTAIRTDTSPQRTQQIDSLNTLLASENEKAPLFFKQHTLPLRGESLRRTSHFGEQRIFRYSNGKSDTSWHYGLDFGVPIGTPVFSTGDGTVVMAEHRISTGYTIVIEHFPGLFSLFYHLDSMLVEIGEFIPQGTLIAKSGNTGLSTGPHLHIEFRLGMQAISPDWFFSFPSTY